MLQLKLELLKFCTATETLLWKQKVAWPFKFEIAARMYLRIASHLLA
jgi:hypothetical protein